MTLFVSAGLLLLGAAMARRLPPVMECPVDAHADPDADLGVDMNVGAAADPGADLDVDLDAGSGSGPVSVAEGAPAPVGLSASVEPRVPTTREAIEPAGSGRPAH